MANRAGAGVRWRVEAVLGMVFAVAAVVTAAFPRWIEAAGIEPDGGSGSTEWGVVAVLGLAAGAAGALSVWERHRAMAGAPGRAGARG